MTHGFVGADLASLSKEAAMIVLRRVLPDLKLKEEEAIPKEILEDWDNALLKFIKIFPKEYKEALRKQKEKKVQQPDSQTIEKRTENAVLA